jgi:MFS family permease
VLVGAITAPYAIAVDAASFLGSALLLGGIRRVEETASVVRRRMRTEIAEGLRYVVGNPILRSMMLWVAANNFFTTMIFSIFLVFAVRDLHLHAATIGMIITLANICTLLGALTATRLSRRLGVGPTILVLGAIDGFSSLFIPFARGGFAIPFIVVARFVYGYCAIGANVNGISLYQTITPDRMLGRANASRRFVVWGVIPFGGLIGGVLGSTIGLRHALLVGAIGSALSFLPLLRSPLARVRVNEDALALS